MLFSAFLATGSAYYLALRIVVTTAAAITAYDMRRSGIEGPKFWILVAVAFVFNPVLPVHLYDRRIWMAIDWATAIFLITLGRHRERDGGKQ